MSSTTQRRQASAMVMERIAMAVERVHAMPLEWHLQLCRCAQHDPDSTCGCRTCTRVREGLCPCCGQATP